MYYNALSPNLLGILAQGCVYGNGNNAPCSNVKLRGNVATDFRALLASESAVTFPGALLWPGTHRTSSRIPSLYSSNATSMNDEYYILRNTCCIGKLQSLRQCRLRISEVCHFPQTVALLDNLRSHLERRFDSEELG